MTERPVSAFSRRFAAHLQGLMKERNIRQIYVAEKLGRSAGYVSEHLNGRRPVNSDILDAIAEVGGISSNDLFTEIARRMANDIPRRDPDRPPARPSGADYESGLEPGTADLRIGRDETA